MTSARHKHYDLRIKINPCAWELYLEVFVGPGTALLGGNETTAFRERLCAKIVVAEGRLVKLQFGKVIKPSEQRNFLILRSTRRFAGVDGDNRPSMSVV
jgi:hypothetical protein